MNLDKIIRVARDTFVRYPDAARPDNEILVLLNLTLKNNDFEFDEKFYLQVHGTAMGKKCAPSLANLYLQYFDLMATTGFRIKPLHYSRFLDDIYLVWSGSVEELDEYNLFLNTIIEDITVTLTNSMQKVNFLDTTVYKLCEADVTTLQTKVYFKDTDSHQLLHTKSFHPKHTTKLYLVILFITLQAGSQLCLVGNNMNWQRGLKLVGGSDVNLGLSVQALVGGGEAHAFG